MYPNLGFFLEKLLGHPVLPIFYVVQSFGFLMAVSFLFAAWVLSRELRRKEKQGWVRPVKKEVVVGAPASVSDLVWNGIIGFIIGFKLIGMIADSKTFLADPQHYILSGEGNLIGGIVMGAALMYWKFREKAKQKTTTPEKKTIELFPHQMVGDITIVAAISGILGAKVFDSLEHWSDLIRDPISTLLSFSGLAFWGGLVFGFLGVAWFCRKNKISILHMADAAAPALILAYGLGRIGCQVSGDGDWGVLNSAYITQSDGKVAAATPEEFNQVIENNHPYYAYAFSEFDEIPEKRFRAPGWIPVWLAAQSYPNNVNEDGVPLPGCEGKYCNVLPVPVFPTPVYETVVALFIFAFMMSRRKKINAPGIMFSLYLILSSAERFLIEMIRVNPPYNILGITLSQAQIISIVLVFIGIIGMTYFPKIKSRTLGNSE